MNALRKCPNKRKAGGAALPEFTAGLLLFFCFFFVPMVDMSFVPVRYLLVHTYLEKVVHRMALCEKRSDAIKYANTGAWKGEVQKWGVIVKNAKTKLIINDNSGSKMISVESGNSVPPNWLPNSSKKGEALVYSLELSVDADIPPLFSGDSGLPGFNKALPFTFKNHAQWENLSVDPLKTANTSKPEYFINQ